MLSDISRQVIFLSCLCGSEHTSDKNFKRIDFLSCLCGSELGLARVLMAAIFLSCLCGSERCVFVIPTPV